MAEHSIFYYPYGSFGEQQSPLLKAAALYFDKLYMLDPFKASWDAMGAGWQAHDLQLLEQEGILVRVTPEEVLRDHEPAIVDAIRADLEDQEFLRLCNERGPSRGWTLALAKVPEAIRNDPRYEPLERSMQRLFRGDDLAGSYGEARGTAYDEYRESPIGTMEYRYRDYPLDVGEAIMLNHALYASLLVAGATPLTDDQFHHRVFTYKIERALRRPELRDTLDARTRLRQFKADRLAAEALTDVPLGIVPTTMPVAEILEYRSKNQAALSYARDRLAWIAREISEQPWTDDFQQELESVTIPKLKGELAPVTRSWTDYLAVAGVVAGGAALVVDIMLNPVPITPLPVAALALGALKDVVIPGGQAVSASAPGEKRQANGLHYFLKLRG
jgi:hypothetical protein